MRDIWGLIVALTGLFIVWLWATGRAAATWQAVVGGNSNGFNLSTVNLNPPNIASGQVQPPGGINALLQFTPPQFTLSGQIPVYVPTIGNQALNIPASAGINGR